jgi:hypothetical protein
LLVTTTTRDTLAYRRFHKKVTAEGYERVEESGHPLWQFARGGRTRERIVDAKADPTGRFIYIKAEKN